MRSSTLWGWHSVTSLSTYTHKLSRLLHSSRWETVPPKELQCIKPTVSELIKACSMDWKQEHHTRYVLRRRQSHRPRSLFHFSSLWSLYVSGWTPPSPSTGFYLLWRIWRHQPRGGLGFHSHRGKRRCCLYKVQRKEVVEWVERPTSANVWRLFVYVHLYIQTISFSCLGEPKCSRGAPCPGTNDCNARRWGDDRLKCRWIDFCFEKILYAKRELEG